MVIRCSILQFVNYLLYAEILFEREKTKMSARIMISNEVLEHCDKTVYLVCEFNKDGRYTSIGIEVSCTDSPF